MHNEKLTCVLMMTNFLRLLRFWKNMLLFLVAKFYPRFSLLNLSLVKILAFSCFQMKTRKNNLFRFFVLWNLKIHLKKKKKKTFFGVSFFQFFENHYVAVLVFNRRFMLNNVANSKNINYSNKIELIKIQNKNQLNSF